MPGSTLYPVEMTGRDIDRCLRVLEETPGILEAALRGAAEDDLEWQPAADRWSITMVLAHLADVEVDGFRSRFEAMLSEDNPVLLSYNPGALFQSGATFDAREALVEFREARRKTLEVLRNVSVASLHRTGRHEDFGTISIEQQLDEFAFHDLGHIRQILELYRAHAFYPGLGAFQSIYKVNP